MAAIEISRTHATGLAALALASVLYFVNLDRAPRMFGGDEAHFATHAESIARTGRDLNGSAFSLFIFVTDPLIPGHSGVRWYQPFLFYALALVLKAAPVTEWSVRLPVAAIGVIAVWLVYAIGRLIFTAKEYAVLAALILAMTPAHLIMSRQALDYIGPVPFVLGWWWCLLRWRESRNVWLLFTGGLLLGVGTFSYIAAWVLTPLLLSLTVGTVAWSARSWRSALTPIAGCLPPFLIAATWFWQHPEMLVNTVTRYELQMGGTKAAAARVAQDQLIRRLSVYWDFFSPSFLFFGGGSSRTTSTAQVGVFLLAVAAFLVVGMARLLRRRTPSDRLLLAGFFAAPLPMVLLLPEPMADNIGRALVLLPVTALIAAVGVEYWLQHRRLAWRAVAIVLLVSMPLQYARFVVDYFTDYQLRAAYWLDPVNTEAVANSVMAQDAIERVPAVYWRDNLDDISIRWKFFMLKHHRPDLWDRTVILYSDPPDSATIARGSLMVMYASDPMIDALLRAGGYSTLATISGIDGQPNSTIVRRDR